MVRSNVKGWKVELAWLTKNSLFVAPAETALISRFVTDQDKFFDDDAAPPATNFSFCPMKILEPPYLNGSISTIHELSTESTMYNVIEA